MSYPMEQPYCEEWDDPQELCLKDYPATCPHAEQCREQTAAAFRRAERADIEMATRRRQI